MLSVIIELVLSYIQFLSILIEPKSGTNEYPEEWSDPMFYLSFLNLGFDVISSILVALEDIRVYFTVQAVCLPLLLMFLGLLFLTAKRVVLWYLITLFSLMLVGVGAFARAVVASTNLPINSRTAEVVLYIGLAGLLVSWILFLIGYTGWCGNLTQDSDRMVNRHVQYKRDTEKINIMSTISTAIVFVIFLVAGILFLVPGKIPDQVDDFVLPTFSTICGIVCIVIAFFALIWLILGFFTTGRKIQWTIVDWMQNLFLRLLLLTMSWLYIPIGTTVFMMFNCVPMKCPSGYRLPDRKSVVSSSNYTEPSLTCIPCKVAQHQTCTLERQLTVCDGSDEHRMKDFHENSCEGVRTFFWPAALLVVIAFLIGLPVIFFTIIRTASRILHHKFPVRIPPQIPEETDAHFKERKWLHKVRRSGNCAMFLFQPFEYKYRYSRLIQLIQKLIVVGSSVYIFDGVDGGTRIVTVSCSLAVHVIATICLIIFRPFLHMVHDIIAIILYGVLSGVCVLGIVTLMHKDSVPGGLLITTFVLFLLIPIVCLIIGLVMSIIACRRERRMMRTEESIRLELETKKIGDDYSEQKLSKDKLLAKVKKDIMYEQGVLSNEQMDADTHINKKVLSKLMIFLMIAGLLLFIALSCCILGLWTRSDRRAVIATTKDKSRRGQLAGYENWGNFTADCCCISYENPEESDVRLVEKWLCSESVVFERVRAVKDGDVEYSGLSVRSMCDVSFLKGCQVVESDNRVDLKCPDPADVPKNPTKYVLW